MSLSLAKDCLDPDMAADSPADAAQAQIWEFHGISALDHVLFWGVFSTSWCTYRFMGVDCIRLFWIIWVFIMYMSLDRERGRDHGIMQMVETRCDTIMDSIMFAFWSNVLWCSVDRVSWQLGTWSAPRQKAWDYLKWSGGMPAMDYPDLAQYPSKISKGWMLMFVIDFAWFSLTNGWFWGVSKPVSSSNTWRKASVTGRHFCGPKARAERRALREAKTRHICTVIDYVYTDMCTHTL